MIQASLDQFHEVRYVPVLVLKPIEVAWKDRDWYLHAQDIVHLDMELAELLARRGMARILNFSRSIILQDGEPGLKGTQRS